MTSDQKLTEDIAHALRLCAICFERRRVIAKVGPFLRDCCHLHALSLCRKGEGVGRCS